jgi:phosphoglycolate phosphatase
MTAHWRGQPLCAVLFDLDGTLLDTLADIAAALNRTVAEWGWAPFGDTEVRDMVGGGSPILIERAAALRRMVLEPDASSAMLKRFFHHYESMETSSQSTARPYPGAAESLRRLHSAEVRIAIVTNKQQHFADALLTRLGLADWVDIVVGGDTCQRRKPDPQPLLFACDSLRVQHSEALMVGDSINDVQAARAARMPVICLSYGYNEGRDPRTLECDALLDTLDQLPGLLLA